MADHYYQSRNEMKPDLVVLNTIEAQATVSASKHNYPVQLGEVDLEAANEFIHSFNQRNQAAQQLNCTKKIELNQLTEEEMSTPSTPFNYYFSRLINACIKMPANTLFNTLSDYLKEVVESCPSYFSPTDVRKNTQWQPNLSLFSGTKSSNHTTPLLIKTSEHLILK